MKRKIAYTPEGGTRLTLIPSEPIAQDRGGYGASQRPINIYDENNNIVGTITGWTAGDYTTEIVLENTGYAFRIIDRTISDKIHANTYLQIPIGTDMYEGEDMG